MSVTALSHLMISPRDNHQPVCLREDTPIDFARFRHDVALAAGAFSKYRAGALLCRDSYNFAVGLFGLMHVGARVLLPSSKSLPDAFDIAVDDRLMKGMEGTPQALHALDPEAQLLDVFTSGSTGLPQKVGKNLACLQAEIDVLEKMWGSDIGKGPVYATVSHQHIYGLTFKILWPLCAGRTFIAEQHALWESLTTSLKPHAILISSPAHLGRLEGLAALSDDKKFKAVFTAGAPLSPQSAQQAETILGCAPREIFGSTETGAIATRLPATEDSWHSLPGVDIRIDDEHALHVRSPFTGNAWLETKDRVEPASGGFYFRGRADTIVKIEGKRISLAAIERKLEEFEEIEGAIAIMLPAPAESLAAVVTLSVAGKNMLADLGAFRMNRHLRSQLLMTEDAAGVPRLWRFVETLPTHPMGKRPMTDIIALFGEAI